MKLGRSVLLTALVGAAIVTVTLTFLELPKGKHILPKRGNTVRDRLESEKVKYKEAGKLVKSRATPAPHAVAAVDQESQSSRQATGDASSPDYDDPYEGEARPNPRLDRETAKTASDYLTHRHGKFHYLGGNKWVEEDLDRKQKFTYEQKAVDSWGRVLFDPGRNIWFHVPFRRGFAALAGTQADLDKPWHQWEWMQPDVEVAPCPTTLSPPMRNKMRHTFSGNKLMLRGGEGGKDKAFHVVYNVEPGYYMDWQSRYNYYWFLETQKNAGYTRLLSADKPDELASIIPTFTAPAYPSSYKPFNKAFGLMHLLKTDRIKEDIIALIDSDCYLLWDMTYIAKMAKKGSPVAHQGYMGPIPYPDNPTNRNKDYYDLAKVFCKNCKFVDPIAVPIFIHREDFKVLAPLWVKKIEEMRSNKHLWKDSWRGGRFNLDWTVEMYGYIFAAAEIGLKHQMREDMELIITWDKIFIAPMIHFSLSVSNGKTHWHKSSHRDEDPETVPHTPSELEGYSPVDQCLLTMTYEAALKAPRLKKGDAHRDVVPRLL